jgi:hypothetical protein
MTQLPGLVKRGSFENLQELRRRKKDGMADVSVWVKSEQTSSERRINPSWSIAGNLSPRTIADV